MKNLKYLSILFALVLMWACSSTSTTPDVTVAIANTEAVKGTDLTLVAVVANNANQVVTWSVVSTTPADDNTVTIADGKLKTTATTTATTVKIKAISKADTSKSVMKDITISSPVTAIAITSEGPATKGTDYTLTATVSVVAGITPAPIKTVTWILVSTTPPDDTTVTIADGKLKTTAATTATTAKVKAMSNADNAQIIMTDITINASGSVAATPPTPVVRTQADYQGMIVGSTGHFFAKVSGDPKRLTIVVDGQEKTISHTTEETSAGVKTHTFSGDGYMMEIKVASDGTVTVGELTIPGHTGALAEIAKVLDTTDKPQIFEGTSTVYLVKAPGADEDATPALTDDNKIELLKYNYNAVLKGDKLIVMSKIISTDAELTRLRAIWSTKNVSIDDAVINLVKHLVPLKVTYSLEKLDNGRKIRVTKTGGSSTVDFRVATVNGKTTLTLLASAFVLPTGVVIRDTAKAENNGQHPAFIGKMFLEADLTEIL